MTVDAFHWNIDCKWMKNTRQSRATRNEKSRQERHERLRVEVRWGVEGGGQRWKGKQSCKGMRDRDWNGIAAPALT